MEWMILPLRRYADFRGRSQRMEFWMFALFAFLAGVVAAILDGLLGMGRLMHSSGGGFYSVVWETRGPISVMVSLALLVPRFALTVRRLHDINRSGWWLLLILVPLFGWIALLVFYCTEGTRGPNRFGPDPRDPHGHLDMGEVFG